MKAPYSWYSNCVKRSMHQPRCLLHRRATRNTIPRSRCSKTMSRRSMQQLLFQAAQTRGNLSSTILACRASVSKPCATSYTDDLDETTFRDS